MAFNHLPFFYLEDESYLSRESSRHFRDVRRSGAGDRLIVSDGRGAVREAEAECFQNGRLKVKLLEKVSFSPMPSIHLAAPPVKGHRMSYLIEKSAELGIGSFQPVMTERTSVRDVTSGMMDRWRRIALSAGMQSRNSWICCILEPLPLKGMVSQHHDEMAVLDPEGIPGNWSRILTKSRVVLTIGPEGGWSNDELNLFRDYHLPLLPLSGSVLRTETAAVAAISYYYAKKNQAVSG